MAINEKWRDHQYRRRACPPLSVSLSVIVIGMRYGNLRMSSQSFIAIHSCNPDILIKMLDRETNWPTYEWPFLSAVNLKKKKKKKNVLQAAALERHSLCRQTFRGLTEPRGVKKTQCTLIHQYRRQYRRSCSSVKRTRLCLLLHFTPIFQRAT